MADDLLIPTGILSLEQTHAGPTLTVKFDGKPLVFAHSKDGTRTCASATNADWDAVSPMKVGFQEAHQLVSALMLTDALRRSGFDRCGALVVELN